MSRIDEVLTPGARRALAKQPLHAECEGCGFPMPKYPGRYPTKCPMCGAAREVAETRDGEETAS